MQQVNDRINKLILGFFVSLYVALSGCGERIPPPPPVVCLEIEDWAHDLKGGAADLLAQIVECLEVQQGLRIHTVLFISK